MILLPTVVGKIFCASHLPIGEVLEPLADTLFYKNYPYIHLVADNDSLNVGDEIFFNEAGKVVFPVNRYELPADNAVLKEFVERVIPQIHKDSLQLLLIRLSGAASPEGSFDNNRQLSERRCGVLFDFLVSHLGGTQDNAPMSVRHDIEDYRGLCIMMRAAGDKDADFVTRLCDTYLPTGNYTQLKRSLQASQEGRLWRHLLRDYYPQLRASRFMLFFRKPAEHASEPTVTPQMPETEAVEAVADSEDVVTPGGSANRPPRREWLSVKTNLLFYGIYMPGYNRYCPIPNVAVEYYPRHGHFTFGASFDFPWWVSYKRSKFFEIRNYQVETRYYLQSGSIEKRKPGEGAAFKGLYVQGYAHCGVFEIGFNKNKGWKGEGGGLGLGLGYVMPLSRRGHWRLEGGLQVGWFTCRYDPFQYENLVNPNYHDGRYYYKWDKEASLFKKRQYRYNWLGPTRVGLTLTYDLLYRKERRCEP
mgnify:CR=1 FL=1